MNKLTRRAAVFMLSAGLAFTSAMATAADNPKVKFTTTMGEFVVEVYPEKSPKTVENFLAYVKARHYDGTTFHRVINNFMVQGGGYDEKWNQRPTRPPVAHEGLGVKNTIGTIAMARTADPNTATAQFFINVADNAFLDPTPSNPGYVAFGKVVSGMDTVNKIKAVATGAGGPMPKDVPKTPVIIQSATLVQ